MELLIRLIIVGRIDRRSGWRCIADRDRKRIGAFWVPSLTVSVSVYAPAVVNDALVAADVAAENVTPVFGLAVH